MSSGILDLTTLKKLSNLASELKLNF